MRKYILAILLIAAFTKIYSKEYTESPYSLISGILIDQLDKETKIRQEEAEKLKAEKKIKSLNEKEKKELEKRIKKQKEKEEKAAKLEEKRKRSAEEAEKREKRKDYYTLFATMSYPSYISLPLYSIKRETTAEFSAGAEYNRRINNRIDLGGALSFYQSGIKRKDKSGMYRGPEFSVYPIEIVGKYKTKLKLKDYKLYFKSSAGYPLVIMKNSGEKVSGLANFGVGTGLQNNRFVLELVYNIAVMEHNELGIEVDNSKLMLKAGYIF